MKDAKYYIEHEDEAKALIEEIANDIPICEYGSQRYNIIANTQIKWYSEDYPDYLRFPFAVEWYIDYSEKYFGKNYSEILTINETLDGLQWSYEDYYVDITESSWLFIGYASKLEDKIKALEAELSYKNREIEKLENQGAIV